MLLLMRRIVSSQPLPRRAHLLAFSSSRTSCVASRILRRYCIPRRRRSTSTCFSRTSRPPGVPNHAPFILWIRPQRTCRSPHLPWRSHQVFPSRLSPSTVFVTGKTRGLIYLYTKRKLWAPEDFNHCTVLRTGKSANAHVGYSSKYR